MTTSLEAEDLNKTLEEIEQMIPDEEDPEDDEPFCLKDGEKALQFPYEKCSGCPAYSFCHDWHTTFFGALQQNLSELGSIIGPEITQLIDMSEPLSYLLEDLEHRVKRDKAVKLSVFFTALSAYLPEPINLFVRGESSSGKSYNVTQTLEYFPKEDVWFLGGLSPTALIHDKGELYTGDGTPLKTKPIKPSKDEYSSVAEYKEALQEYREELLWYKQELRDAYVRIDLSHKILVFLEAPVEETFRTLYPILSHDKKQIEYRFTDKTGKGQLQTSRVIIEGWPAAIFCTASSKYMEELSTRSLSVTPETSTEKIHDAMQLTAQKASMPWEVSKERGETQVIKALVSAVKGFFAKADIVVPCIGLENIFSAQLSRDMRDFKHFIAMLKAITAFHVFQRPLVKIDEQVYMLAQYEDVKNACDIFENILETTKTGMETKLLQFYHNIVEQKEAWFVSDLVQEYNKQSVRKVSRYTITRWLERLSDIGYVTSEDDPTDKRVQIWRPLVKTLNTLENNCANMSIQQMHIISSSDWQKGLESWLKNMCTKPSVYIRKNVYSKWKEVEPSVLSNYLNHIENKEAT